jgi:hypothetical protein
MNEWTDIPGYESYYQICQNGTIRTTRGGRIRKIHYVPDRYAVLDLSKAGVIKTHSVHRLMGLTFLPNPDGLPEIDHIDRNKHHNNITNLRWVTKSENQQYRPVSIAARAAEAAILERKQARPTYSGHTNIKKLPNERFAFDTRRGGHRHYRVYDTIEEAIVARDTYFADNPVIHPLY